MAFIPLTTLKTLVNMIIVHCAVLSSVNNNQTTDSGFHKWSLCGNFSLA